MDHWVNLVLLREVDTPTKLEKTEGLVCVSLRLELDTELSGLRSTRGSPRVVFRRRGLWAQRGGDSRLINGETPRGWGIQVSQRGDVGGATPRKT